MVQINLRDYYSTYHSDMFVEVPEEVAEQLRQWERDETAYRQKQRRYKAQYSLDIGDGVERDIVFTSVTPDELYERKLTRQQLYSAIAALPHKQAKRINAYFIIGMSQAEIARAETVAITAVNNSIIRGLRRLEQYLKQNL